MKRIIHIDVPKSFTLAVREFNVLSAYQCLQSGVDYDQIDLNPSLWRFLEQKLLHGSCIQQMLETVPDKADAYAIVLDALEELPADEFCSYSIDGVLPVDPAVALSTRKINEFVASLPNEHFLCRFGQQVLEQHNLLEYDLISLGAEREADLIYVMLLARMIKAKAPTIHLCIGRHHSENFSLLNRLDTILENGSIFKHIDSIVLHEEFQAKSFLSIVQQAPEPVNVAIQHEEGVKTLWHPRVPVAEKVEITANVEASLDRFMNSLDASPQTIHYNLNLINNQCYYSKCVFCAQIAKHSTKRSFNEQALVELKCRYIALLTKKYGVQFFSFIDEAIRPKDLKYVAENGLLDGLSIQWNMRLIADSNFDEALVDQLWDIGCREVLFGLETIDPDTALSMGKISHRDDLSDLHNMIFRFSQRGIGIILSMIYNFPTATASEDEELLGFAQKLLAHNNKATFIFNQFSLFGNTPMIRQPETYGITEVISPPEEEDINNTFAYSCKNGSCEFDLKRTLRYTSLQLGIHLDKLSDYLNSGVFYRLHDAQKLAYMSWGFTYECSYEHSLYADLKYHYEQQKN